MNRSRSRHRVKILLAALAISTSLLTVTASPAPADAATFGGRTLTVLSQASQLAGGLRGVCLDSSNNIYFANNTSNQIFKMTSVSQYTEIVAIAGTGQRGNIVPGLATASPITTPRKLICRPSGNILFTAGLQVGKLTLSGSQYTVSVIAGSGSSGFPLDGSSAASAPMMAPVGIAVASSGVIYGVDQSTNEVYSLTPSGNGYTLNIIAGTGSAGSPLPGPSRLSPLNGPTDIVLLPSGALVLSDTNNNAVELLTPSANGWNTSVVKDINSPRGMAVDIYGNIAVASTADSVIYVLVPSGDSYQQSTYVGTGVAGSPTSGPALSSNLSAPRFLAFDSTGNLYIGDTGNSAIEVVSGSSATPPGSPTVSAQAVTQSGSITFNWYDSDNGGSDITIYNWSGPCSGAGNTTTVTCTGLTGGAQYSLTVFATNALGTSSPGVVTATAVTNPAAPTNIEESATAGSIVIWWNAPTHDGGSAISNYVATATDSAGNSTSCSTIELTCSIDGLANRTSYDVQVVAFNTVGGSPGASGGSVSTLTTPGAPTAVNVLGGPRTIAVWWNAPTDDGGAPVTSYRATATDALGNSFSCDAGPGISSNWTSCNIDGLANGTSYVVTVVANNAAGASALGMGGSVSTVSIPASPTVTAEAISANGSITFNWYDSDNGGSDITLYHWSGACSGSGNVTTITCTGLAGGVSYTLYVTATNAVGDSDSGSYSTTAKTAPASPTAVNVLGGPRTIAVWWNAPTDDGGAPVTSYRATATDALGNSFSCDAGPGISSNWTSCNIGGLMTGTNYEVRVIAINVRGSSQPSVGMSTLTNRVPGAPLSPSLIVSSRMVRFSWLAPSDNGGSEVTAYTVSDGSGHQCVTTGLTCTIFNLTNGIRYRFSVTATSLAGTSTTTSFTDVTPIGAALSQRISGFAISSAALSDTMTQQITTLARAIVAAGRWSVTITGFGNPGMRSSARLARAARARDVLRSVLAGMGHSNVTIAIAAGPSGTTFGSGGPAKIAAATRCVVIVTH